MQHVCRRMHKARMQQIPFWWRHVCTRATYVMHTWHVCITYVEFLIVRIILTAAQSLIQHNVFAQCKQHHGCSLVGRGPAWLPSVFVQFWALCQWGRAAGPHLEKCSPAAVGQGRRPAFGKFSALRQWGRAEGPTIVKLYFCTGRDNFSVIEPAW